MPTNLPTISELRRLVKKRERERFSAMWFLEPIQVYFSYLMIRLGMNSIQVTVLWFVVALGGYAVNCIGTPIAFICGAILLYLKTILDGSDGEVARYRKQFVSEEEDLKTFINGVYLDKAFHIIEKPLWGLSLAFGLFVSFEEPWIFAAGLLVALFHTFCRHNATLQNAIPHQFAEKFKGSSVSMKTSLHENSQDSIPVRIVDKINIWIRNGKRYNLLILICSLFDLGLYAAGSKAFCLVGLLISTGAFAPLLIGFEIWRTIKRQQLIHRAIELNR